MFSLEDILVKSCRYWKSHHTLHMLSHHLVKQSKNKRLTINYKVV